MVPNLATYRGFFWRTSRGAVSSVASGCHGGQGPDMGRTGATAWVTSIRVSGHRVVEIWRRHLQDDLRQHLEHDQGEKTRIYGLHRYRRDVFRTASGIAGCK